MKIYTRCVIDIKSGEILEEESFEYEGEVSWCGGSSGGGSSGRVDYPGYMKDIHENWLTGEPQNESTTELPGSDLQWNESTVSGEYYISGADSSTTDPSLSKPDNIKFGTFGSSESYPEGTPGSLNANEWGYGDNDSLGFDTIYFRNSDGTTPESLTAEYYSSEGIDPSESITGLLNERVGNSPYAGRSAYNPDSRIEAMDSAVRDFEQRFNELKVSDGVQQEIAQFDAAMRDINAVNTSNFVIGRAIIASGFIETKFDAMSNLASLRIEANRIAITAKAEQVDADRKIDQKDALWDMQIYQLGGNIMASIGGGTVAGNPEEEGPSSIQSALGGGLSGAATGASIGGKVAKGTKYEGQGSSWGAAIGAIAGAGAALYSS